MSHVEKLGKWINCVAVVEGIQHLHFRFEIGNLARAYIPKPDVVCFPVLSSIPPISAPPPPTAVEQVVMPVPSPKENKPKPSTPTKPKEDAPLPPPPDPTPMMQEDLYVSVSFRMN